MNGTRACCLKTVMGSYRFFKFHFQTIGQSHLFQGGFDISKCNHKFFSHLHLIKTKQISNATCKVVLILGVSVIHISAVGQSSFAIESYDANFLSATSLRLCETQNALQLPMFFFFFLSFCQPYPEYRKIRRKKLFYRPSNRQYNSVICSDKKEIFRVYSFSEQVAAKGNSVEVT